MVVAPTDAETLERALSRVAESFRVVERSGRHEIVTEARPRGGSAMVRALSQAFRRAALRTWATRSSARGTGCGFACMSGAMANGIGSVEIVEAMARVGFLGVFGSAGLSLAAIEHALDRIERSLGESLPFGMNLIHSPGEPDLESAVVDLYLRRGGAGWSKPRRS